MLFWRHLQPVLVEYLAETELLRRENPVTWLFTDLEQQEMLLVLCMIVEGTHVELAAILFEYKSAIIEGHRIQALWYNFLIHALRQQLKLQLLLHWKKLQQS